MSIADRLHRLEETADAAPAAGRPKPVPVDYRAIEREILRIGGPDAVERLEEQHRRMVEEFEGRGQL
jgi:hypothetical protein